MDTLVRDPDLGGSPESSPHSVNVTRASLALLAVASLAAAVVHAAFAPTHFDEYWGYGTFFAVSAWYQAALGAGLLVWPSRKMFAFGLLNVVAIGAWIVSRRWGMPFGPQTTTEAVGFPDALAAGLEVFVVIGCGALLARTSSARVRISGSKPLAIAGTIVATLAIASASTAALTPRYAADHHHDEAGVAAAGHDHGGGAAAGSAALAAVPGVTAGDTPCEKTGPPASEGQLSQTEGHSHRGPATWVPIDKATTEKLAMQQEAARSVADTYPTVAAAEAAGYAKSTPYVPCIGAHYTNISLVPTFDPAKPSELLFDGTNPDSKLVGLSYLVYHPGGAPEGFAGPNDLWHQHNQNGGLCFGRNGVVIGGEDQTEAECAARGGAKRELTDIWMVHDWIVPGYECNWGVFAGECPALGGRVGGTAWDA